MRETCFQAINVLSGFPEVELKIQPKIDEELFNSIMNLLEKYIKQEQQDYIDILLDSMIEDKKEYHKYIDIKKEIIKDELKGGFSNLVIKEKYIKIFDKCIIDIKLK